MACLHVAPYLTISPVSPSADGTFIPVGVGIGVFLLLVMSIVVVLIVVVVVVKKKTNTRKTLHYNNINIVAMKPGAEHVHNYIDADGCKRQIADYTQTTQYVESQKTINMQIHRLNLVCSCLQNCIHFICT